MPASTRRSSSSSSAYIGKHDEQSVSVRTSHESVNLLGISGNRVSGRLRSCLIDDASMSADSDLQLLQEDKVPSPPILSAFNWTQQADDRRKSGVKTAVGGKENGSTASRRYLGSKLRDAAHATPESARKAEDDQASSQSGCSRIRVYVRLRPMSIHEKDSGAHCSVRAENQEIYISEFAQETDYLRLKRLKDRHFTFDAAFSDNASQQDVYSASTAKLVEAVLQGKNCSVFCYGATGAGKTYTMLGSVENPGVMLLALTDLFARLEQQFDYNVRLSYLEVYNESVRDLLSPGQTLVLREDSKQGITASGLTHYVAKSAEEVMSLLQKGNQNRQTEPTRMNETSSRSHAILQVVAEHRSSMEIGYLHRVGKLSLIDLAGSERALATDIRTARSLEGANINRSLLALSSCINALVEGKKHIPYRNSKLTQLLKDSLGGSCQTAMIANISPSSLQFAETQNTLHWASRAKKIRSKAYVHEEVQVPDSKQEQAQLLLQMQKENKELKLEIARLQQEKAFSAAALVKAAETSTSPPSLIQSVIRNSLDNQCYADRTVSELRKALHFLETSDKNANVAEKIRPSRNEKQTRPKAAAARNKIKEKTEECLDSEASPQLVAIGRPLTRLLEKKLKEEQMRRRISRTNSMNNLRGEIVRSSGKKRSLFEFLSSDNNSNTNSMNNLRRRIDSTPPPSSSSSSLLLQGGGED